MISHSRLIETPVHRNPFRETKQFAARVIEVELEATPLLAVSPLTVESLIVDLAHNGKQRQLVLNELCITKPDSP